MIKGEGGTGASDIESTLLVIVCFNVYMCVERTPKKKALAAAIKAADVEAKFAATPWGKKMASRKTKLATNDFERYKAMVKKIKTNSKIRATLK